MCALALSAGTAQSGPVVQPLREFDVQVAAAGRWHPVAMDWDARGRIWVATAEREGARRGKLLVFRATPDGAWALEREFYSGATVRGFVFSADGVLAATDAGVFRLRDRNGDGKADSREPLFAGRKNPATLHGLRQGFDGWNYAVQRSSDRSSEIVRFRPEATDLEVISRIESGAVSFDMTWEGELFFSSARGPHVSHVGLPERHFGLGGISNAATWRKVEDHQHANPNGAARARHSFIYAVPGVPFRSISGACIYEGGAWPERFHGNFYTCDSELRLVHEDVISRAESAYYDATRRVAEEFITSADESFRPHAVRYGPDGALYVLGSSPPGTTPNSVNAGRAGLLVGRPKPAGHIWRVQHRQSRGMKKPDFAAASMDELVEGLENANGWTRQTALRLLVERAEAATPERLVKVLKSSRTAQARLAALWGLQRLGALDHATWTNAIADLHPAVQKTAWLALAASGELKLTREIEKLIEKHFKDADERVRIAMLSALSQGPLTAEGRQWMAKVFPDLKDVWCKSVVLSTARHTPLEFLKVAFASDKSENYRELAVPLVEQVRLEVGGQAKIEELAARHEKAEKLTAAVKEALAREPAVSRRN